MPSRRIVFVNKEIYHIYNKTIDHRNVFSANSLMSLFVELLWYYQQGNHALRFSHFQKLELLTKKKYWKTIILKSSPQVELLAYVLMPNHFHLLVKQKQKMGIVYYLSQILNSFTRGYNNYHQRLGPIFLPRFKAKIILSSEQLLHTSRYIHLNPYSSAIVNNLESLKQYPFSSLLEYLQTPRICQTNTILSHFNLEQDKYWEFLTNNALHQKDLEEIKHFRA
jgi:putative transposase